MRWSLRIGKLFDIPVQIHFTFPLLLAWVGFSEWSRGGGSGAALAGILFVLAIFGCVVLHELGHALAARRFGIRTRDVTLLPIGGVARLERMPEQPSQELWVALAGPAVNVVIALLLGLWLALDGALEAVAGLDLTGGSFAARLLAVNIALVAFNMVPAFPMDGGRVLRAVLAARLEYGRATTIAAGVGQAFALLFGITGLFLNPLLILIAIFVWFGAAQEAQMARMKSALGDTPIGWAMLTDFETLAPGDSLARAAELTLAGSQKDFPVVDDGRMVGLLRQGDLFEALRQLGGDAPVARAMRRDYPLVERSEVVEAVFARLQASAARSLPVTRDGRLVGLATLDNISEYLAIRRALGARPPIPAVPSGRE